MKVFLGRYVLFFLAALFVQVILSSCEEEEEDLTATMCYTVSGSTLTVNCKSNKSGTCADDGKSSLANYATWDACFGDFDAVLDNWKNNSIISPGPNSLSGGSGGTGGSGANCDTNPKVVEYRTKLNQGCQPCANCAILAFVKCNEPNNTQLINLYKAAVQQDEVSYGVKTCPELY
jgi:hypothetical protein